MDERIVLSVTCGGDVLICVWVCVCVWVWVCLFVCLFIF